MTYKFYMVETDASRAAAETPALAVETDSKDEEMDEDTMNVSITSTDPDSLKLEEVWQKILKALKKTNKEKNRLLRRKADLLQST